MSARIGSHIRVRRLAGYWHHGIYVGEGMVVHFNGEVLSTEAACIQHATMDAFADGGAVEVVSYGRGRKGRKFSGVKIAERAANKVGESGYHLFNNNCEHFATWCVTGKAYCDQIVDAGKAIDDGLDISSTVPLPILPRRKLGEKAAKFISEPSGETAAELVLELAGPIWLLRR
jgi:hypothetical protein